MQKSSCFTLQPAGGWVRKPDVRLLEKNERALSLSPFSSFFNFSEINKLLKYYFWRPPGGASRWLWQAVCAACITMLGKVATPTGLRVKRLERRRTTKEKLLLRANWPGSKICMRVAPLTGKKSYSTTIISSGSSSSSSSSWPPCTFQLLSNRIFYAAAATDAFVVSLSSQKPLGESNGCNTLLFIVTINKKGGK